MKISSPKKTKEVMTKVYYKHPTATIDQLMEQLNSKFKDLAISKATVYRYMTDM
jgi:hypothetical protein